MAKETCLLYREMVSTGEKLSVLGFGCMRLPHRNGRIDPERAVRQLHSAVEHGVNYFDTAVPYHMGESEPFLGRAFQGGYRERVHLATKLPHWAIGSRQDMDDMLDAQLANLRTDRIDYYLLHNLQASSWQRLLALGVEDFLDRAKADGRIRHAGFSSHANAHDFRGLVHAFPWSFCQIQYNFLNEQIQAGTEGLCYASGKGLGVVVMGPLQGGRLAQKVPAEVQAIWDRAPIQRTPVEWALRWLWNHPEISVVLSGMEEEVYLEENLRIASEAAPHSLTEEELALVERVVAVYESRLKVNCTKCRYCMPCPAGVDIPACFEIYNSQFLFDDRPWMSKVDYLIYAGGLLGGESAIASLCVGCGRCERVCPQHLPIRDLLAEVAHEYEFVGLKPLLRLGRRAAALHSRWAVRRGKRRSRERPAS
jgi:predicted aldo/keto reductase-like oxidoreductase